MMHVKRMHRVNEERGMLKCERCGRVSMRRDREQVTRGVARVGRTEGDMRPW